MLLLVVFNKGLVLVCYNLFGKRRNKLLLLRRCKLRSQRKNEKSNCVCASHVEVPNVMIEYIGLTHNNQQILLGTSMVIIIELLCLPKQKKAKLRRIGIDDYDKV